jgi:hypothetical protein
MVKLPGRFGKRDGAATRGGKAAGSAADPAAMADAANAGRLAQLRMVAGLIRKNNPRALPITIGSGLAIIVACVLVGLLTGTAALLIPFGVLVGLTTAAFLWARYSTKAQYAAIEGRPGAAVVLVQRMRGSWTATATVAGNRNLDMVHRVVGKPGVILIGEGSPSGLAPLLAAEKRKIGRIAYGVPITEIQIGNGAGQVPISKLQRKLMTMPRALKPRNVRELNDRMKAMPALQPPRGPMPRAGRMPRPPRPKMR